jgi:hypothetical protein
MASQQVCEHPRAHFHSIQRLGDLPPVELWQCPVCRSTISRTAKSAAGPEVRSVPKTTAA